MEKHPGLNQCVKSSDCIELYCLTVEKSVRRVVQSQDQVCFSILDWLFLNYSTPCELQDPRSLGLAFCAIRSCNPQVYSFGMVMLELLTGLAPATADATRMEMEGT